MSDAIHVSGLSKVFGGKGLLRRKGLRALDEVELAVPRGAIFGLVGLNGAGKTTFIKVILGIVHPSAGAVRVLGGSPEDLSVRRRIGYLPERLHLPGAWKPRAFLSSIARFKGISSPKAEIERQLSRVELLEDAGRRIGGFSKGMRQRLGLAATLLGQPDLLVLDEPTDGIDPLGRVSIRGILREENRRGATVFLNSHLLSETERVCDRLAVLHRGSIMREGPIDSLRYGLEGWRIRFATPPSKEVADDIGLEPDEQKGFYRFTCGDAGRFNEALVALREAGALIVEASPIGRDLEALLARVVGSEEIGDEEKTVPDEALEEAARLSKMERPDERDEDAPPRRKDEEAA